MLLSKGSIACCGPRSLGMPSLVHAPRHAVASAAVKFLANRRKACTVSAAAPPHEQHQQGEAGHVASRKPSAMPRLPERPAKRGSNRTSLPKTGSPSSSSSSSSSSSNSSSPSPKPRRPLPPSLPPEQQQQQAQERTLAGLLAYSGLLGTIATVTSVVAPDVDLFGGFQLVPADIVLGLQLLLPCCLLNLAIMLPDYSSWKVPEEPTLEAQQKMAEALLAWTANKKAAADAASKPAAATAAASDPAGSSSSSSGAAYRSGSSDGSSNSSSSRGQADQEPGQTAESVPQPALASSSSSSDGADVQGRSLPAGISPPWMINNPDPPLPLPLARCKDALLMAQGHYLSSTPRVALPWPMQVGVLPVNCMAAELLYRSVLLQVLGGWLTDRTLEAGAEDWFLAAAAHLPVLPTPHITGQLTAVALLSGAWGAAVVQQVLRMSRRPSMVMASQGRAAAGKLMEDMQRLAGGPAKQQQQQQHGDERTQQEQQGPDHQQQPGDSSRQATSAEEQASSSSGPAVSAGGTSPPSRSKEAAKLALAAAADPAGPSSAGSSRPSRQGMGGGLPNTLGALALSQAVTGVRDLSQFVGLGLAFALTGNLAAPFVAALVTDGLMAVLQRHGQERSRQRSIAFAKHFARFTRVLRDVQRQQTLKQGSVQEQSAPDSQQQAATPPSAGSSSTQDVSTAAGMPLASTSSLDVGNAGGDDALDAAVTAAVAVPDAAALHAAAAAAVTSEEAAGAVAGGCSPAGGSSRMESTINLLDQLVVEQLAEHAAAAGPHK